MNLRKNCCVNRHRSKSLNCKQVQTRRNVSVAALADENTAMGPSWCGCCGRWRSSGWSRRTRCCSSPSPGSRRTPAAPLPASTGHTSSEGAPQKPGVTTKMWLGLPIFCTSQKTKHWFIWFTEFFLSIFIYSSFLNCISITAETIRVKLETWTGIIEAFKTSRINGNNNQHLCTSSIPERKTTVEKSCSGSLTLPFSTRLVIMTMTPTFCSQTICQKSPVLDLRGPWAAMYARGCLKPWGIKHARALAFKRAGRHGNHVARARFHRVRFFHVDTGKKSQKTDKRYRISSWGEQEYIHRNVLGNQLPTN